MKPSQSIRPITYMKTNSANLIKEVTEKKSPIIITQNGEAKAVVMDINSFEEQKDTLLMLKLVIQGEQNIKNNKIIPQLKVFKSIEDKLFK